MGKGSRIGLLDFISGKIFASTILSPSTKSMYVSGCSQDLPFGTPLAQAQTGVEEPGMAKQSLNCAFSSFSSNF